MQQVVGVLFHGCVDTGHTLSVTHVEVGASTEARVERARYWKSNWCSKKDGTWNLSEGGPVGGFVRVSWSNKT